MLRIVNGLYLVCMRIICVLFYSILSLIQPYKAFERVLFKISAHVNNFGLFM